MNEKQKENSIDSTKSSKYLTFKVKNENYGIDVNHILQLIAIGEIRRIPGTPDFVKGVINLRGKIIPVIDLRLRFGLEEKQYNHRTSIIITRIQEEEEQIYVGIIVDTVLEVLDINENQIEPSPEMTTSIDSQSILGLAKVKEKVVILLDTPKVLSGLEFVA